ncbi:MAG: hypothetical protein HYZ92_00515 [Candidatus Omnitrophica bacterium]|nr:hypothetical protein [Candidatus Omnitrophota bacterium]
MRLFVFLLTLAVSPFPLTSHRSPHTSHLSPWALDSTALADVSKGTSRRLQTGSSDQGGEVSSTAGRRQQSALGSPVADGLVRTSRFRLQSGFLAAAIGSSVVTIIPPNELDLTSLIAKTEPMGADIPARTWQKDSTPAFLWQPPAQGLDIAGYSYALDAQPDDTVDTAGTSWYVAQDAMGHLADGVHTFRVKAVNTAGNAGKPISFEIWIDTTAPVLGSYSPTPGSLLNSLSPKLTVQAAEPHSGIDPETVLLSVNGSHATVSLDPNGLLVASGAGLVREGSNRVEVQVPDRLGNVQPPLVWSFTVDVTPPSGAVLINGGTQMTTSIHVTLNLTASDAISGVSRMLISNDIAAGYVEEPFGAVRELWRLNAVRGPQKVYVKFVDGVGNISEPVSDEIELGLLSPETTIISGPAGVTPEISATFTFSCPEGGCVFSFAFDHEKWSNWAETSTASAAALSLGNHYFKVKAAKEINGTPGIQPDEEDPTPAERTWIVGTEFPSILVPRGPPIKLWRLE